MDDIVANNIFATVVIFLVPVLAIAVIKLFLIASRDKKEIDDLKNKLQIAMAKMEKEKK